MRGFSGAGALRPLTQFKPPTSTAETRQNMNIVEGSRAIKTYDNKDAYYRVSLSYSAYILYINKPNLNLDYVRTRTVPLLERAALMMLGPLQATSSAATSTVG